MVSRYQNHASGLVSFCPEYYLPKHLTTAFVYLKLHESCIIDLNYTREYFFNIEINVSCRRWPHILSKLFYHVTIFEQKGECIIRYFGRPCDE